MYVTSILIENPYMYIATQTRLPRPKKNTRLHPRIPKLIPILPIHVCVQPLPHPPSLNDSSYKKGISNNRSPPPNPHRRRPRRLFNRNTLAAAKSPNPLFSNLLCIHSLCTPLCIASDNDPIPMPLEPMVMRTEQQGKNCRQAYRDRYDYLPMEPIC